MLKKTTTMMILAALISFTSVQAQEAPNFDFFGHVLSPVPSSIGEMLDLYSVLTNGGTVPTPIPMTWAGEEHTFVMNAMLSGSSSFSQFYATGTVEIWTDVGPASAHDFSDTSTFENGELILSGTLAGTFTRNKFTPTLGNFVGDIDWTGGTRLGELSDTTGWGIGGAIGNTNLPSGYDETWDGKTDEPEGVAVESETWGAVKDLYKGGK